MLTTNVLTQATIHVAVNVTALTDAGPAQLVDLLDLACVQGSVARSHQRCMALLSRIRAQWDWREAFAHAYVQAQGRSDRDTAMLAARVERLTELRGWLTLNPKSLFEHRPPAWLPWPASGFGKSERIYCGGQKCVYRGMLPIHGEGQRGANSSSSSAEAGTSGGTVDVIYKMEKLEVWPDAAAVSVRVEVLFLEHLRGLPGIPSLLGAWGGVDGSFDCAVQYAGERIGNFQGRAKPLVGYPPKNKNPHLYSKLNRRLQEDAPPRTSNGSLFLRPNAAPRERERRTGIRLDATIKPRASARRRTSDFSAKELKLSPLYLDLARRRPLALARAVLECFRSFSEIGGYFLADFHSKQFSVMETNATANEKARVLFFIIDGPLPLFGGTPQLARPLKLDNAPPGLGVTPYLLARLSVARLCSLNAHCPPTYKEQHCCCAGPNSPHAKNKDNPKAHCDHGSAGAPEAAGQCREGECVPLRPKTHSFDVGAKWWLLPLLARAEPRLWWLAAWLRHPDINRRPSFSEAVAILDRLPTWNERERAPRAGGGGAREERGLEEKSLLYE